MHRIFKKNQILTIPNLLSVIRITLIPQIVWLYNSKQDYYAAIGVILLSGATDIVDGWIARHFNMVSDFGKALDPLADKLTQASLLICLLSRYRLMWMLLVVFGMCEITKLVMGIIVVKKCDEVNSAKWYGKLNTVMIYSTMLLLILFPKMNTVVANLLMLDCGLVMIIAHILYFRLFAKRLSSMKISQNKSK